ncbi:MAG: hypothetical protein AAB469_00370 [Patescibacteria group bacterium]
MPKLSIGFVSLNSAGQGRVEILADRITVIFRGNAENLVEVARKQPARVLDDSQSLYFSHETEEKVKALAKRALAEAEQKILAKREV